MAPPCARCLLAAFVLLALLSSATHAQQDTSQEWAENTVNDLFMRARSYEDSSDQLLAMRTYQTALRVLPSDLRIRRKLLAIHRSVVATVPVKHDGRILLLPIFGRPHPVPAPATPGSADSLVAAFFRWHKISIFRSDSGKCAAHQANVDSQLFTVMGQTCLSTLYAETHNAVQVRARRTAHSLPLNTDRLEPARVA
ncbi:hypothetical protein T484DRAFT_1824159 [Baffinella frigidus]|nr:hypothetical protein T484DRAFT_1824159 [Cryptophyta sp. CCMP2293]